MKTPQVVKCAAHGCGLMNLSTEIDDYGHGICCPQSTRKPREKRIKNSSPILAKDLKRQRKEADHQQTECGGSLYEREAGEADCGSPASNSQMNLF